MWSEQERLCGSMIGRCGRQNNIYDYWYRAEIAEDRAGVLFPTKMQRKQCGGMRRQTDIYEQCGILRLDHGRTAFSLFLHKEDGGTVRQKGKNRVYQDIYLFMVMGKQRVRREPLQTMKKNKEQDRLFYIFMKKGDRP